MDDDRPWPEVFIKVVPGILALMFSATYCFAFIMGMFGAPGGATVEVQGFSALVAGVVGYWFAQKGQEAAAKQATVAATTATTAATQTATGAGNGTATATKPPEVKG